MYAALTRLVEPANSAVTWNQVSSHLRLDSDSDEELVMNYAQAATEWVESYLDRALITQTLQYTISDKVFTPDMYLVVLPLALTQLYTSPHQYVELPRSPCRSITSVKFNQNDGTQVTTTDFNSNLSSEPSVVTINYMPSLGINISNVQLTYVAGYGATSDKIPASIKHAVLMLTAFLYEQRGDVEGDMPKAVTRLLTMYRLQSFS